MTVQLVSVLSDITEALDSPRPAADAAKALEDTMRSGTSRMIGADLRLSGFKGPAVKLDGEHKPGLAFITLGGATYALADGGRRNARRYITPKGGRRKGHRPALMTPAGPRYRVKGSRTRPMRITETYGPKALEAAVEAASEAVVALFAGAL